MRPVKKGAPYSYTNGSPYISATQGLIARIGSYCSYCERPISAGHEVDHIQPKSIYPHLECDWSNFLLSCKSCNATKSHQDKPLSDWLIPDRDNTFLAYSYLEDGVIKSRLNPASNSFMAAENTLSMMKLNKDVRQIADERGKLIAIDRRAKRMEIWAMAKRYREKWDSRQDEVLLEPILDLAQAEGFFSIWMEAFSGVPRMRLALISRFQGTETDCFDGLTSDPKTPHPNSDNLPNGSKI